MRDEKILYVSDLDGTLLNSDQTLSEFTVNTINRLVEQGMMRQISEFFFARHQGKVARGRGDFVTYLLKYSIPKRLREMVRYNKGETSCSTKAFRIKISS